MALFCSLCKSTDKEDNLFKLSKHYGEKNFSNKLPNFTEELLVHLHCCFFFPELKIIIPRHILEFESLTNSQQQLPEIYVAAIDLIPISPEEKCQYCGKTDTILAKCIQENCKVMFHLSCLFKFERKYVKKKENQTFRYGMFCEKHRILQFECETVEIDDLYQDVTNFKKYIQVLKMKSTNKTRFNAGESTAESLQGKREVVASQIQVKAGLGQTFLPPQPQQTSVPQIQQGLGNESCASVSTISMMNPATVASNSSSGSGINSSSAMATIGATANQGSRSGNSSGVTISMASSSNQGLENQIGGTMSSNPSNSNLFFSTNNYQYQANSSIQQNLPQGGTNSSNTANIGYGLGQNNTAHTYPRMYQDQLEYNQFEVGKDPNQMYYHNNASGYQIDQGNHQPLMRSQKPPGVSQQQSVGQNLQLSYQQHNSNAQGFSNTATPGPVVNQASQSASSQSTQFLTQATQQQGSTGAGNKKLYFKPDEFGKQIQMNIQQQPQPQQQAPVQAQQQAPSQQVPQQPAQQSLRRDQTMFPNQGGYQYNQSGQNAAAPASVSGGSSQSIIDGNVLNRQMNYAENAGGQPAPKATQSENIMQSNIYLNNLISQVSNYPSFSSNCQVNLMPINEFGGNQNPYLQMNEFDQNFDKNQVDLQRYGFNRALNNNSGLPVQISNSSNPTLFSNTATNPAPSNVGASGNIQGTANQLAGAGGVGGLFPAITQQQFGSSQGLTQDVQLKNNLVDLNNISNINQILMSCLSRLPFQAGVQQILNQLAPNPFGNNLQTHGRSTNQNFTIQQQQDSNFNTLGGNWNNQTPLNTNTFDNRFNVNNPSGSAMPNNINPVQLKQEPLLNTSTKDAFDWLGDLNPAHGSSTQQASGPGQMNSMDFLGKNLYLENIFSTECQDQHEMQDNLADNEEEWLNEEVLEQKDELLDAEKLYLAQGKSWWNELDNAYFKKLNDEDIRSLNNLLNKDQINVGTGEECESFDDPEKFVSAVYKGVPLRFKDKNYLVVLFKNSDENKDCNYLVTFRIEPLVPEHRLRIIEEFQGGLYEFSSNLIPSSDVKRLMVEKTLLDRQLSVQGDKSKQKIPLKTEFALDLQKMMAHEFNLEIESVSQVDNSSLYESIVQELLIIMIRNDPKRNDILTTGNELLAEGATLGHFLMYSKLLKNKQDLVEAIQPKLQAALATPGDDENMKELKRVGNMYTDVIKWSMVCKLLKEGFQDKPEYSTYDYFEMRKHDDDDAADMPPYMNKSNVLNFQKKKKQPKKKSLKASLSILDTDCCVCFNMRIPDHNVVVYCSGCRISCHKYCYGIKEIPYNDFYCDTCQEKKCPAAKKANGKKSCMLCPVEGFPLKKIQNRRFHPTCLYLHNLGIIKYSTIMFRKAIDMRTIASNIALSEARFKSCIFCNLNEGLQIKCFDRFCTVSFHVLCAYLNGMFINLETREMRSEKEFPKIMTQVYCDAHCPLGSHDSSKQKFYRRFAINFQNTAEYKDYNHYMSKGLIKISAPKKKKSEHQNEKANLAAEEGEIFRGKQPRKKLRTSFSAGPAVGEPIKAPVEDYGIPDFSNLNSFL